MSSRGYCRGHKVYYDNEKEEWLYSDDNTSAMVERPCKRCKMEATKEGHDYCLKGLSNCNMIKSACCGHGVKIGYIILSDGRRFVLESEKHPTNK